MSNSNGASDHQPEVDPEVQEQLKLVALGCNEDCHERLDRLFREEGVYTWLLIEYLLVKPANTKTSQKPKGLVVVEPFIERRLEALPFIPNWSPDPNNVLLVPSTEETRKEYLRRNKTPTLTLGDSKASKILLERWRRDGKKPLPYFRQTVVRGQLRLQPKESHTDPDLLNYYLNDYFWTLSPKSDDRDLPGCDLPGCDDRDLPGCDDRDLPGCDVIALPIASACHFYGVLVVQCPAYKALARQEKLDDDVLQGKKAGRSLGQDEGKAKAPEPKPLGEKLVDFLYSCAREKYLPILALCHNRLAEKKLKKELEKYLKNGANPTKEAIEKLITETCVYDLDDGNGAAKPVDQDLDDILVWLWRERKQWLEKTTLYNQNGEVKGECFKALQDSLRFWDYGVASQPLLRVVDQAMRLPFEHKENPTKLDAALVVGGPGSGKDNLARLVPLFCKGYSFAKIQTINMAAIRPQALVGPILQGLEPSAPSPWGFESILPIIAEGESYGGKTVILDELNSMDIDQQGVLLRILENAEISPLMSREPKRTDFLCVGVMNEDPEDLMKEEDLRSSLTRSPLLGRILGTVTDELFRQSRRLRPDLYYRMARPAVLKIPPLAQRPHDIPLLFYIFLPRDEKYDLRLMRVATADGLVNEGRNLVIVALVGTHLYIRIFDASGKKVVDMAENELVSGETLTALKNQLKSISDESGLSESGLSKEDKQKIIGDAISIAGHTRHIDLAAYRALMDKTLPWPGNVRELQAVTTKIYQRARERGVKDSRASLRITRTVVEDVLDEHFHREPPAGESRPG